MPRAPEYIPGAPLYAREPLRFSGVVVAVGGVVPDRPDRQRRLLWSARKATHMQPRERTAPQPPRKPSDLTDAELELLTRPE